MKREVRTGLAETKQDFQQKCFEISRKNAIIRILCDLEDQAQKSGPGPFNST